MDRKSFKNLILWQKAYRAFEMIVEDVEKWPKNPIFRAISYQLLDSGGSISANIAEGYGRGGPGDFERFILISRGSMAESDDWLFKACKQGLITEKRYSEYEVLFEEIGKISSKFIGKLREQRGKKPR